MLCICCLVRELIGLFVLMMKMNVLWVKGVYSKVILDFFVCFFCLLEGCVMKIILVLFLMILLYVFGV